MTDDAAFQLFMREFEDMVYATAVRLLGRPADAEDVAQMVFLRAFERFEQIGASPAAAGWLKTVTIRTCLNHLSRYRKRWRFFSELGPRFDARAAGSLEDDVARTERQASVERALRRLPDPQRVPLVLFHYEDMSYDEIAATLGVSLAKVKTDIHRGREALRKELSSDAGAR